MAAPALNQKAHSPDPWQIFRSRSFLPARSFKVALVVSGTQAREVFSSMILAPLSQTVRESSLPKLAGRSTAAPDLISRWR